MTEMLLGERGADLMLRLPLLLKQASVQSSKILPTKSPEFLHRSVGLAALHRFIFFCICLSVPLHMTYFSTGPR